MTPEHAAYTRKSIEDSIQYKTQWIPLLSIPSVPSRKSVSQSAKEFWKELNDVAEEDWCGVYQVSLTCPEEIIHKDIGYVGTSEYFPYRLYNLKCSTTSAKNTHHKCGRFLHYSPIEASQVYVRMLYINMGGFSNPTWLEGMIHDQMRVEYKYQYGFQWEQASGGPASSLISAFDGIARLTSTAEIAQVEHFLAKHKANLPATLDAFTFN